VAPSESEAIFRIHFRFIGNNLQRPTCDSPARKRGREQTEFAARADFTPHEHALKKRWISFEGP
jgi:hypothetical protein